MPNINKPNHHYMRLILPIIALSLFVFSCNEDDNTPLVCDEGYEGAKCDTEMRAKFIGDYAIYRQCAGGNSSGNISIRKNIYKAYQMDIAHLLGIVDTITAIITISDTFTIGPATIQGNILTGAAFKRNDTVYIGYVYGADSCAVIAIQ